ncbi:helix-turn-helix domain-containing protein [candidate division WWE3 bacterium]|uniref:Helix-turn-helix domain-containing protein n=1 Tax=candidate division WWE3 bacterium TaxID=2053526 RepID=A0A955LVS7_UNCKA|nr:helix-turn-helix domain-containing protein [candidate division WWE3 bacterium]
MKTVGDILRDERLKQKKTLEQISEITKIRPSILDHIEKSQYEYLPGKTYIQGFVRSYAQALNMDIDKALAFFRREYGLQESEGRTPPQPIPNKTSFVITPGKIFMAIGSLFLVGFLAFLIWQYQQFAGKPLLIVNYPPAQTVVQRPFVNVSGQTDTGAIVTINGEQVPVSQDGNFQVTIELQQGINTLEIKAQNNVGKETVIERDVQVTLENEDS